MWSSVCERYANSMFLSFRTSIPALVLALSNGPTLCLPLFLLDVQHQFSLGLLDHSDQVRKHLHAVLDFSLSAAL